MKRSLFLSLSLCLITAAAGAADVTLYVSPAGNDAWSGKPAQPDAAGTDGPLATLAGARDAVRKLKASGVADPIRVQFREGVYRIEQPVSFSPEDSGTDAAPVFYEAYPGERPVISGGRAITGWKQEGNLWSADLPDVRDGKWTFGSLWVNGQRRQIARTPNAAHPFGDYPQDADTFYIEAPITEKGEKGDVKSNTKFKFKPGDIQKWESLPDAIFVVYHSWETSLLRIKNVDFDASTVEFTGPAPWPFTQWVPKQRYYVENLREGLDQPGEWYLDRKAGKLLYIPMPGESMDSVEVVAPAAQQLILLEGKPAEGKFVANINFNNLRMYHTDYKIEPQGHSDSQAASTIPAAFQAVGARKCSVSGCEIGHVATYGLWWREGCRDNAAKQCEIFDLGAGGVRIGETGDAPSENQVAGGNAIDNCFIHDGGLIFRGAVGAWIGRSSNNTLSHNEICDFRYTGISVGWSWGYAPSSANNNIIEYNNIYEIGKEQLNDMGGIYTLGISPGTVIRYNVFHDVYSYPPLYGGWGIYFDEGSTDIVAENNLVYGTLTGTFHQHYGRENKVHNNIFAYSKGPQLVRSREEEHISFIFERNIVFFNNGQLLGSTWKNDKFTLDYNCYWDASSPDGNIKFGERSFDEWKAAGHDTHSIIADPKFANPAAADFTLAPDSPALTIGFKPIDLSKTGLYGNPEWINKPKQIKREPFKAPKA